MMQLQEKMLSEGWTAEPTGPELLFFTMQPPASNPASLSDSWIPPEHIRVKWLNEEMTRTLSTSQSSSLFEPAALFAVLRPQSLNMMQQKTEILFVLLAPSDSSDSFREYNIFTVSSNDRQIYKKRPGLNKLQVSCQKMSIKPFTYKFNILQHLAENKPITHVLLWMLNEQVKIFFIPCSDVKVERQIHY